MATSGETALHSALVKPDSPYFDLVVRVLLGNGANPNVATKPDVETGAFMRDCRTKGETPLHRAAAFGTDLVGQLVRPPGRDPQETVLRPASHSGRPQVDGGLPAGNAARLTIYDNLHL